MDKVFALTDLGNSERFLRDHSATVRWCPKTGSWYVWDGTRWIGNSGSEIQNKAIITVRSIPQETTIDPSQMEEILKHAARSETLGRINAMVKLATAATKIQIGPEQFDANPMLLNCPNGTLDLETGRLLKHDPNDFVTMVTGTEYRADAKCPQFLKFSNEIMGGNPAMVDFLQKSFGYGLTGSTREQCIYFLVGSGSNGKTTVVESLRKVLGSYAAHTPTASLTKNSLQIRNDLARLRAVRFVTASEVSRGKELDEATTKMLTGEDPVTARFLFKEFFEYRPSFKLFLIANHVPEIRGTEYGIWRRILLVPFPVTIPPEKVDKHLAEKLEQELPGILAWLVSGCLKWQKDGLQIPPEVKVATDEYRKETDIIPQFLADRCELAKDARVSSRKLYEVLKLWAAENMDEIPSAKAFGLALKTAGFKPSKSNSVKCCIGLRLKTTIIPSIDMKTEKAQSETAGRE